MHARLATAADVDDLIRLRAGMAADIRGADERERWEADCRRVLAAGLDDGSMIAAVVADPDSGRAVSAGVAAIWQWLPGPRVPEGWKAYVGSMFTEPGFRGRGAASAVLDALLAELWRRGVGEVELHATDAGAPIYARAGFSATDQGGVNMRRVRPAGSTEGA